MSSLSDLVTGIRRDKDFRLFVKKNIEEVNREKVLLDKDKHIRASGIYYFCPRREALKINNNVEEFRERSYKTKITDNFGRAFEVAFRDEFLASLGLVIGRWSCLNCKYMPLKVDDRVRYKKPDVCSECNCNKFKYEEEFLYDPYFNVGGHPDAFIMHSGDDALLELKTANAFNFKSIKTGPIPAHVGQLNVYMKMSGIKKGFLWYFNKDTSEDFVYLMEYDQKIALYYLNRALEMKEFFSSGKLPSKICDKDDCALAKKCLVKDICFATKDSSWP